MSSLRRLRARYRGRCRTCNSAVAAGAVIYHDKFNRQLHCEACGQPLFEAQRHAPPRSTDQSIARREISTRYILVWAAVAAVVLFCIGLSSDRLWASTLSCAILCAICCSPTKTGSGSRALLLAVSVALLLVAAGSLTSDYLDDFSITLRWHAVWMALSAILATTKVLAPGMGVSRSGTRRSPGGGEFRAASPFQWDHHQASETGT
jgi:predicted membrane protein